MDNKRPRLDNADVGRSSSSNTGNELRKIAKASGRDTQSYEEIILTNPGPDVLAGQDNLILFVPRPGSNPWPHMTGRRTEHAPGGGRVLVQPGSEALKNEQTKNTQKATTTNNNN